MRQGPRPPRPRQSLHWLWLLCCPVGIVAFLPQPARFSHRLVCTRDQEKQLHQNQRVYSRRRDSDNEDDMQASSGSIWSSLSRREQLAVLTPAALGLVTGTLMLRGSTLDDQLYDAKHKEIFAAFAHQEGPIDVLEIGIGGGANFRYYPKGTKLTGVDPGITEQGKRELQVKASAQGITLDAINGEAESMPYLADGSFDAVVSTLVLCTVKDPASVLSEVHRVLRPGGRYCFIEHVKAPPDTFLAAQQDLFDPLQQLLAGGCHLTRQNDRLLLAQAAVNTEDGGGGGRGVPPPFSRMERFEYLDLGSKWPVSWQVAGVLVR